MLLTPMVFSGRLMYEFVKACKGWPTPTQIKGKGTAHSKSWLCNHGIFGALHPIPVFKPVDHETSRIVLFCIGKANVGKKKTDRSGMTSFCNDVSHSFTKKNSKNTSCQLYRTRFHPHHFFSQQTWSPKTSNLRSKKQSWSPHLCGRNDPNGQYGGCKASVVCANIQLVDMESIWFEVDFSRFVLGEKIVVFMVISSIKNKERWWFFLKKTAGEVTNSQASLKLGH